MSEPTPEQADSGRADDSRYVEVDFDPFAGAAITSVIPTTEAQREVWLADQLDPVASLAYNESVTIALRGAVDVDAMRAAVHALTQRHDVLRAVLSNDGTELLIQQDAGQALAVDDLSQLPEEEADTTLTALVAGESANAFDLVNGPLFRARLISLTANEHALVLGAHHIVCDGFSFAILIRDLAELYRSALTGVQATLPPADSFADYAAGLAAAQSQTDEPSEDELYWLEQFRPGLPAPLDLPTSKPRAAQRSFASARLDLSVKPDLVRQIRQLAGQTRSGTFAVLLTGFATLMARLSGQQDLVIGVPSAGQTTVNSETLVGHCVNLLPLRLPIELNQNVREAIAQVQQNVFDAFDHQRCTYGSLLKKLPIERDPSRPTLVSVMFNLDQALEGSELDFGGLTADVLSNPRQAENFEMFLNISQTRESMTLECQYNTDLFDEGTVRLWLSGYRAMLKQMAESPDLPLAVLDIIGQQQAQAIARLNATETELPPYDNLGQWLTLSATAHADNDALLSRDPDSGEWQNISYAQLEGLSNQLARALRQRAISRGKTVGICLPRDARMLIAQWAVIKSGAAYVPLDPTYPEQRLTMMAQDAGIELVISTLDTVSTLDLGIGEVMLLDHPAQDLAELPTTPLPGSSLDARAGDPIYLIYTSGSTGRPKGVRVPHRAVLNFLSTMSQRPGLTENDRLLAVTTLSFDIAVLELLLPAVTGAQVVLADTETARDGAALLRLLNDTDATVMQATPSTWRLLLDAGLQEKRNLKALVGGEAFPSELSGPLLRHCASVWNLYGPTETTVWSTLWRVRKPGAPIRIGRPIGNTRVHVLDERAQPCPIGVPGEIVIAGAGVALGYHNQPLLTTERFLPDTVTGEPGARMYRTGDLGRWTWTGDLEHLGRLDQQVKIRGFRIELGEIEASLQQHPAVRQAVVVTRARQADDVRLIAYLVGDSINDSDLRDHLRRTLPDYMVPQHFVFIESVPLLNNGKVNRKALPEPEGFGAIADPAEHVAADSELEHTVLDTMADVLGHGGLGMTDDFFTVGGHSILAARVISRLNETLGLSLPMRTIFEAPTAAQLVAHIAPALHGDGTATQAADSFENKPVTVQADQQSGPLTPMQQRVLFVEQMTPGRVIYNVPSAHRLRGPIDLPRFERALATVVARQPSLRTVIDDINGQPKQKVLDSVPVRLPLTDLSEVVPERREITLHRKLDALIAQTFDLSEGPLFRGAMIRMAEQEHVFFFMAHHLVWDGWSFDVLYEEMAHAYRSSDAEPANRLAPLPVSYIDFAHWQQQFLSSPAARQQIAFWAERLARQPRPQALPADQERSGQRTGEGETVWIDISEGLAQRLRELASRTGTTLNMLMLAAYSLLMSDMATDKQIVIGMPMRGREKPEFEVLTGFFNNMLPLHLRPQPELPFTDWLNHVRHEVIDILANQSVPFERLATEVDDAGKLDYQVLFSFQDARERTSHWGNLEHSNIPVFQRGATEDLGLWLLDGNDGLKGGITYNTDLYRRDTARALRRRFSNLLRAVARHPDMTIARLLPRMHRAPANSAASASRRTTTRPAGAPASTLAPATLAASTIGRNTQGLPTTGMTPPTEPQNQPQNLPQTAPATATHRATRSAPDFTPVAAFEDTLDVPTMSTDIAFADTEATLDTSSDLLPGATMPMHAYPGTHKAEPSFHAQDTDIAEAHVIDTAAGDGARTEEEDRLAAIWAAVLGLASGDQIERDDNFFDMGGTSLQAMQVMDRIEAESGRRGNPRLMVFGSLRQLALSYFGEPESDTGTEADTAGAGPDDDAPASPTQPSARRGFFGRLFRSR